MITSENLKAFTSEFKKLAAKKPLKVNEELASLAGMGAGAAGGAAIAKPVAKRLNERLLSKTVKLRPPKYRHQDWKIHVPSKVRSEVKIRKVTAPAKGAIGGMIAGGVLAGMAANKYNNRKKTAMFDEGGNVPPSPQSKKIPKRPRNAAWQYDPRPVWTL